MDAHNWLKIRLHQKMGVFIHLFKHLAVTYFWKKNSNENVLVKLLQRFTNELILIPVEEGRAS
jgi:hypothetical protein